MRTYVAEYDHDGRAWVVQFQDPDISTWGRTLRSAKGYARELLRAYLEVSDLVAASMMPTNANASVRSIAPPVNPLLGGLGAVPKESRIR